MGTPNRRTTILTAAVSVFCVVTLSSPSGVGGSPPRVANVVRAKQFELVDDSGRVRAVIGTDTVGQTGLLLPDATGATRAALTTDASGTPEFDLRDASGTIRLALKLDATTGEGAESLMDPGLKTRLLLQSSGLGLFDSSRHIRAALGLDAATASPGLYLYDVKRNVTHALVGDP